MEIKKIKGVVFKSTDYSESSKILNIMTDDYGIVGIIAKGAKNPKNKLSSVTNLLTYGYFNVYYKKDKLSTLISVDVIDDFKNIKKDIELISYATFLTELTSQVIKNTFSKEAFENYINGLTKINEGFNPRVITNILELKFLDCLGIKPSFEECVSCGSKQNIVGLSSYKGGFLCNQCIEENERVSNKVIGLIRMFYLVDISSITKIKVNSEYQYKIDDFINDYYDRYSGLYLNSKKFLENVKKYLD